MFAMGLPAARLTLKGNLAWLGEKGPAAGHGGDGWLLGRARILRPCPRQAMAGRGDWLEGPGAYDRAHSCQSVEFNERVRPRDWPFGPRGLTGSSSPSFQLHPLPIFPLEVVHFLLFTFYFFTFFCFFGERSVHWLVRWKIREWTELVSLQKNCFWGKIVQYNNILVLYWFIILQIAWLWRISVTCNNRIS